MRTQSTPPQDFLKTVLLLGPDNPDNNMCQNLFMQAKDINNCTVIGGGTRLLSEYEIIQHLKGRIDDNTKILIAAHGKAINGKHEMLLLDGENETTNYLLQILAKCSDPNPLSVQIHSCFAGAAAEDASVLPKTSTVVCYGPSNETVYLELNTDLILRQLVTHQPIIKDVITELPSSVVQSMTIAIKLNNGQVTHLTLRPPTNVIVVKDSFRKYLDYQVIKLKDMLAAYHREGLLPARYVQKEAELTISESALEECMHKYFIAAVLKNRDEDIKTLLKRGFDPNFSWQTTTPLLISINQGSTKITAMLLEDGYKITDYDIEDIDDINKIGINLIMDHAIKTNDVDTVSNLIKHEFKIADYFLTKIINHKKTIDGVFVDNSQIIEACLMNKTIQSKIAPQVGKFYAVAKGKADIADLLERTFPQTVSQINKIKRIAAKIKPAVNTPSTKDH